MIDLNRFANVPLCVSERDLGVMTSALEGKIKLFSFDGVSRQALKVESGVAIIPVRGGLVHHEADAAFGMTSYEGLSTLLQQALSDKTVQTILLDIDSGGGEASGLFTLVQEIEEAQAHKRVVSVINEHAYSAAYAIAAATERIYLPETGGVGSVGVLQIHTELTQLHERAGITVNVLRIGSEKAKGNAFEALDESTKTESLQKMQQVGEVFFESVARNRALSAEAVKATQARTFVGEQALTIGFADEIQTKTNLLKQLGEPRQMSDTNQSSVQENRTQTVHNSSESQALQATDDKRGNKGVTSQISQKMTDNALDMNLLQSIQEVCAGAGVPDRAMGYALQGFNIQQTKFAIQELLAAETAANIDASFKTEQAKNNDVIASMIAGVRGEAL